MYVYIYIYIYVYGSPFGPSLYTNTYMDPLGERVGAPGSVAGVKYAGFYHRSDSLQSPLIR